MSIKELIDPLDKSKPIILLDHQAFELEEVEKNNIDLQLSGQMNLGQTWPFSWIIGKMYEKAHGYLKKRNTHIYVSSGIGINGGKFRIGTQSEYVIIHLQQNNKR
jgi:predicted MPP superfamily phosphohydrolase